MARISPDHAPQADFIRMMDNGGLFTPDGQLEHKTISSTAEDESAPEYADESRSSE